MLSTLEKRGVAVDLTVEPGRAPTGAAEIREAARGLTPDYRGVPTRPYRSTPGRFPACDPVARADPLLVPLLSAPRRRPPFRRVPLGLWEPFNMARLAAELLRKPPIAAFAIRSSHVLGSEWDVIEENLELLAHITKWCSMTASTAVEHQARASTQADGRIKRRQAAEELRRRCLVQPCRRS